MLEAHAFKCGQITRRLVYLKEGHSTVGERHPRRRRKEGRQEEERAAEREPVDPNLCLQGHHHKLPSTGLCFGLHRHRISQLPSLLLLYLKKTGYSVAFE
ncbi:hypothetical protein CDAR_548821 [Caerostris darwini]|uniref:Uncharacterized protein n=1 Tax=Caerostris darwini TaxID=1538125 RepID=A0AAV4WKK9_9ARAC|nr:hypothetical protein CDAR_548821 [Caerostris darwini]